MKRMLILFALVLVGCTSTGNVVNTDSIEELREVTLKIEGMTCAGCAAGVAYQLKQLDGVVSADIDHKTGKGLVLYDGTTVTTEEIVAASTTYPVTVVSDKKRK